MFDVFFLLEFCDGEMYVTDTLTAVVIMRDSEIQYDRTTKVPRRRLVSLVLMNFWHHIGFNIPYMIRLFFFKYILSSESLLCFYESICTKYHRLKCFVVEIFNFSLTYIEKVHCYIFVKGLFSVLCIYCPPN